MKIILKSSVFKERLLEKTYEDAFLNSDYKENNTNLTGVNVQGSYKDLFLTGTHISYLNLKAESPFEIKTESDFSFLKLHFQLNEYFIFKPSDKKDPELDLSPGYFNLAFFPLIHGTSFFNKGNTASLEIIFTKDLIQSIMGDRYHISLGYLGQCVRNQKNCVLWKKGQPISPEIYKLIEPLINCEYCGPVKKAYLEAKVTELLVTVFTKIENEQKSEHIPDLISSEDYFRIIKTEGYIRENLSGSLTIPELSVIAGLNTNKLKQCFKYVFSTTVFKYITDLRMEKAVNLIKDDNYSVAQAAYEVGYKNPQHFTVAFKKKYGYLPKELGKEG